MTEHASQRFIIFTDGACSGNPGPGGWGAIVADISNQMVRECGGAQQGTTNNRMELQAAISALESITNLPGTVDLYTDSVYAINGITKWVYGWLRNNWKTKEGTDVSNAEFWKQLFALVKRRGNSNPIRWHYVRGHMGTPGNERVDSIAVAFSKGLVPALYRGSMNDYSVDLNQVPADTSVPESSQRPSSSQLSKKPVTYLSLVGGVLARHQTWTECEARVKGQSGAKFKKVSSPEEEEMILKQWRGGHDPQA